MRQETPAERFEWLTDRAAVYMMRTFGEFEREIVDVTRETLSESPTGWRTAEAKLAAGSIEDARAHLCQALSEALAVAAVVLELEGVSA